MYTKEQILEALSDPNPANPIAIEFAAKLKEFSDEFKKFMVNGGAGKDYKFVVHNELERMAATFLADMINQEAEIEVEAVENASYTTAQAAELLGLSVSTLRVYLGNGEFPSSYKLGRDWFITGEDIEEFKAKRRPKGRPITTGAGLRLKKREIN